MFHEQTSRHDPRGVVAAALREFVPPTPSQVVSPPADDLEGVDLLPDASSSQVQRDQVAQAHGAQLARDYFERQRQKLDELEDFLNKRITEISVRNLPHKRHLGPTTSWMLSRGPRDERPRKIASPFPRPLRGAAAKDLAVHRRTFGRLRRKIRLYARRIWVSGQAKSGHLRALGAPQGGRQGL